MGFTEEARIESEYLMGTYARKPVQLVSGKGMVVIDSDGKEYLDFVSGVGADSLGHCHPALVSAIQDQAAKLIHVSNYYYIERRGELARSVSDLLNKTVPADQQTPWKSFFSNSGAEANECAIKLARLYARKNAVAQAKERGEDEKAAFDNAPRIIVSLKRSFHGRTLATLAATAQPAKQDAFQPLPGGFEYAPINDTAALEALFEQKGDQICAVLVECIQGESGVHPCTPEYLQDVRRITSDHGALLMCDEVQCGMFRCGEHPFGFQHMGIVPDVVSIAKGVASGFPMGMCAARSEVAAAFAPGDHGSTFGGSCLAIAAAKATVDELSSEGFADQITRVGKYLQGKLAELPNVIEIRGYGLMVGADLSESVSAGDVVTAGLEDGLLLNCTGPHTLRFLPPLVCTEEEVDVLVAKLATYLK